MAYILSAEASVSESTISSQLSRLVASGHIERLSRGSYCLPASHKHKFTCLNDSEIQALSKDLTLQFPYASICLWSTKDISSLMHHIPSTDFIVCNVEKDAAQYVYEYLASRRIERRLFLRPSSAEVERYVFYGPSLIVRNLVSEAPMTHTDGILCPEIEKILVDIVGDNEFCYVQGSELNRIFANAFETYDINTSKLLRYARRRGREEEVKSLAHIEI